MFHCLDIGEVCFLPVGFWGVVRLAKLCVYESRIEFRDGGGRLWRNRLKRMRERTDPQGTAFGNYLVVDRMFLFLTWAW